MSGHSKWHNIQAKKGKADAARGKIFTKLGRELLIAVEESGPDPAGNSKLKNVIERNTINFDENQIVKSISQKLKEKDNIIKKLENQINSTKNFDNQDSKQRIENIRKKRGLFN